MIAGSQDGELMRAVAGGDRDALGPLYDRYAGVVFPLCLRILRDRSDAEEVLGDVFRELWTRPERFDPRRGNLQAYLFTLARSRAIDRLRSRKSRERREVAAEVSPCGGDSPFEDAVFGERRDRVRRALAELEPAQRAAIELSFFSGLSHGEISAELGEPLGTIKSRIRGGLIRLRDSLRTLEEDRNAR